MQIGVRMSDLQWLKFPLSVKWYITSNCNLRCTHCYLSDYTIKPDLNKILAWVDFLGKNKVQGIYLLGGEPFLRDDLETIISRIVTNKMYVSVATNGTLLTYERAEALKKAGLFSYQISLEAPDAITNDNIRGKGSYNKVQQAIKVCQDLDLKLSLAFTINALNRQDINDIFEFAHTNKIRAIRLMPFAPIGTGGENQELLKLKKADLKEIGLEITQLMKKYPELYVDSYFLQYTKEFNCIGCKKSPFGCGAGTTDLIINSDFSLSACDLLAEFDKTIPIGDVSDIKKYWLENPLFNKWRGKSQNEKNYLLNNFDLANKGGFHILNQVYNR
jgi:MoaA/NifB/PqqE/SkfB family radical SAM enzyme